MEHILKGIKYIPTRIRHIVLLCEMTLYFLWKKAFDAITKKFVL